MNKKIWVCSFALIIIIIGLIVNVEIRKKVIESDTYVELDKIGYSLNDVKNVKITHSCINKVLGYNEWQIYVTFKKDPDVIFPFTYKNKKITPLTIEDSSLDKEQIQDYETKFENGYYKNK